MTSTEALIAALGELSRVISSDGGTNNVLLLLEASDHMTALAKGNAMYEHVRTMSARAFTDLWCASISGGSSFDDLVLGDMEKRKGDRA